MSILGIIGIIVSIIGIILIILVSQYNKFQWTMTLIEKGETSIMHALEKKYDILLRYIDFLKKNGVNVADTEYEEFKLLNTKQPLEKINKKINKMNNLVNKYMDDNEKLLKNETVININKELMDIDIIINGGKKYYNDNLTVFNHLCNSFPAIIVAKIKKYKEKEYLDGEIKEELKILED